jgi:hypothetical protein
LLTGFYRESAFVVVYRVLRGVWLAGAERSGLRQAFAVTAMPVAFEIGERSRTPH